MKVLKKGSQKEGIRLLIWEFGRTNLPGIKFVDAKFPYFILRRL